MMRVAPLLLLPSICAVVATLAGGCGAAAEPDASTDAASPASIDAEVSFVTFPSIERLVPSVDVARPDAGDAIELHAARGEREGGQLVAWATRGAPRVVLDVEALRAAGGAGRIPAANVRVYIEQPMRVERGSPAGRAGTYVDPLLPAAGRAVELAADQRLLVWVDVEVPLDAAPGSYAGDVGIRAVDGDGDPIAGDDAVLARVPIAVRVHAVTLPREPTLGSHVGVDASQLVRFEQVEAGSVELREVTDRYAAELAGARLSIGDVGVLPPRSLPGERARRGDAAYLQRVFTRRGVASVRLPFYLDHPFADPLGLDRAAALDYLRRAARWARRSGFIDRTYVFAIDEPDESRAGEVRELHELVHEADPALRLLVTREASAREFQGSVDIWTPNISPVRFRRIDVAREARRGHETWWYPSITTWQPYPTLFIDELRPTPRALGWLAWRYGVRGILYWSATHWHEIDDPWRDPATYNETDAVGNGDGVLLYPGGPVGEPGTPMPSIRLLQLRDGIDDHDLLTLAACATDTRGRVALRRAAATAAPTLDRVDPTAAQVDQLRAIAFRLLARAIGSRAAACTKSNR